MEQLLLHLFGEYSRQTNYQAQNKTNRFEVAVVHAITYTLPFLFITQSALALAVMFLTHVFIDHFRLAKYVIFAKNWFGDRSLKWEDCSTTGYHYSMPPHLSTWLLIIVDNTMHLTINYLSLRYL